MSCAFTTLRSGKQAKKSRSGKEDPARGNCRCLTQRRGGIRRGAAGFDITFLHPKGNDEFPIGGEGVLIELVQAPPEVVKAFAALAAQAG